MGDGQGSRLIRSDQARKRVYTGQLIRPSSKIMAMVLLRLPPAAKLFLLLTLLPMAGVISCNPQSAPEQQPEVIRGLKAFRIAETSGFEVRRYPSVVRPSQESKLSFEISGQLGSIDLEIGQMVNKGDALAEIDPVSLQFQVQQSKAALAQSKELIWQ